MKNPGIGVTSFQFHQILDNRLIVINKRETKHYKYGNKA